MTVPTKEEFDVFIEANNNINAIELYQEALEAFQQHTPPSSFYEASYEIINKRDEILNSKFSALSETSVYKWMYGQRPFVIARDLTFKRGFSSMSEAAKIKSAKSLQSAFKSGLHEFVYDCTKGAHYAECYGEEYKESLPSNFTKTLNNFLYIGGRNSWHGGVAIALSTYFYGEPESSIAKRSKLTEELTQKALKSLADLDAHVSELSLGEKVSLNVHYASGDEYAPTFNKIKQLQELNKTIVQPIKRLDRTAKERLLIFNLWTGAPSKEGHSLGCKVSAITQLLYLEGVENHVEQRSIEKLIQEWKAEKKAFQTTGRWLTGK